MNCENPSPQAHDVAISLGLDLDLDSCESATGWRVVNLMYFVFKYESHLHGW